jgi:indolepyruvate ferredoxin oxidoreductase alpha subunit
MFRAVGALPSFEDSPGPVMVQRRLREEALAQKVLLGDEAVALAAVHAGLTAAYSYPGTPATEILEAVQHYAAGRGRPAAQWCANEKTAYETALGVSFAGKRSLVSMKHVGLNVAADPFLNSAIVSVNGGLVVAVADDPGMHSSQNEQDTRVYADFARTLCLEPADQQETYDMTREAFDLSERFRVPVVVRLVTRLAHSRAVVTVGAARDENPGRMAPDPASWILLPSNARRQWRGLLARQPEMLAWSETCRWNELRGLRGSGGRQDLGVITCGVARNYYIEALEDLEEAPVHLHIGAYPLPVAKIGALAAAASAILILEDGYPVVEGRLRGILPSALEVRGKLSGHLPPGGELTPDIVRRALGLAERPGWSLEGFILPNRPPQLCAGCPHHDAYQVLNQVMRGFAAGVVTSDIGCYTLGALPPYNAIESCVCMGASIGMARGASEAGVHPAVAVIGDSTFLHSGLTPLLDAVAADADMTLLILDNGSTAMTGGQPALVESSRLADIVRGLGVPPEHFHVLRAHPSRAEHNEAVLGREMAHRGLSVIVFQRECVETLKRKKRATRAGAVG